MLGGIFPHRDMQEYRPRIETLRAMELIVREIPGAISDIENGVRHLAGEYRQSSRCLSDPRGGYQSHVSRSGISQTLLNLVAAIPSRKLRFVRNQGQAINRLASPRVSRSLLEN